MKAVLLLIALTSVAHAQESRKSITLADALAATAKAPRAAPAAADVAAAEATFQAAKGWPQGPTVRLGTYRLTARLFAGATMPLPVFGTLGAARRHAEAQVTVARAEADVELRSLRHRVVRAWIELARADGVVVS